MNSLMAHRGPDDSGLLCLDGTCLAMRRLSIIDLSPSGHQPMCNEDGSIWVVCNGEIYNYQDLRAQLVQRGHEFRSKTDTEVIVHLYEEEGPKCVHQLRGMFAFAVWHEGERELFLCRDRLGIKPLYYSTSSQGFLFASEIKSMLESGLVGRQLDMAALDLYLSFGYVPPPWTMVQGISALLPGHCVLVKEGRVQVEKWWHLPGEGTSECRPEDILPQVRHLLEESIRLHQVSDVPVGAFLSGGIDSTAVVGLMSHVSGKPVRTFSVGFESDVPARFNELSYAKRVAKRFGAEHTEVILNGSHVADALEDIVWYLDHPSFDGVNSYFVSRAARQGGLTVALSGLGGDELFGGYGSFKVIPMLDPYVRCWSRLPEGTRTRIVEILQSVVKGFSNGERSLKIGRLRWVDSSVGLYALARFVLWPEEKRQLLLPWSAKYEPRTDSNGGPLSLLADYSERTHTPWRMVTDLDMQTYMSWRLLRDTDAMSMAHSLEVRVPLIDHKVVEFVCGLAPGWQKRFGYPKRLLTTSLSDLIPNEISRRDKHGFEFPIAFWMQKELKDVVEDALSHETVQKRGLFLPKGVRSLYHGFLKGRYGYPVIWQLVVLELWLRKVFDRRS